ncbi:MAG: hypothetical protein B9J98_04300 [Candidatus Terraquivivens tikiterensis]|uniref:Uncharacterized protein n=1 Tax=Candidatus Terraquivivens tikiterensis TaxID=1980982 RepID=A0A2R7Y3K0_9ARCH|nr:MAG: hypothetical protein B9J98_04300 [Candidatus Terraquivivens tikiterensis]
MILETHGDVCRLGYMRLIACLAEEDTPKSFDFLASTLYEFLRKIGPPRVTIKPVGLITRPVNAKNYVYVAAEMNILDRRTLALGDVGRLYIRLDSAAKFIQESKEITHEDVLTLNPVEKVFFLTVLISSDFPFFLKTMLWALERGEFVRMEAMNYMMEEIYPSALRSVLTKVDAKRKGLIEREIAEAENFRANRLSMEGKGEWIKSSQYAKYRHVAPPRLEWLVDLGILRRAGRGRYSAEDDFVKHREVFEGYLKVPLKRVEEEVIKDVAPLIVPGLTKASRLEIASTMIEAYRRLARGGNAVNLGMLERLSVFLLLERRMLSTPNLVHDVFNSLAIRFPDKMFVQRGRAGGVEVAMMDISPSDV